MATVSFEKDIMPLFNQFRARMIWRFDLTKYEDVKGNAALILQHIDYYSLSNAGNADMPPPPFTPLTQEQVATYQAWIDQGCQP
jgi:hypothetical protein